MEHRSHQFSRYTVGYDLPALGCVFFLLAAAPAEQGACGAIVHCPAWVACGASPVAQPIPTLSWRALLQFHLAKDWRQAWSGEKRAYRGLTRQPQRRAPLPSNPISFRMSSTRSLARPPRLDLRSHSNLLLTFVSNPPVYTICSWFARLGSFARQWPSRPGQTRFFPLLPPSPLLPPAHGRPPATRRGCPLP